MRNIIVLSLFVIIGCREQRELKHYKFVATDPDVTPVEKSIIADRVARLFPVQERIIPGKTIIRVDTLPMDRIEIIRDTILGRDTIVKIRTVVNTYLRTDTVYQEDNKRLYSLQQEIATCDQVNAKLREKDNQQVDELKDLQRKKNKWFLLFLSACAVITAGIILKIKRII